MVRLVKLFSSEVLINKVLPWSTMFKYLWDTFDSLKYSKENFQCEEHMFMFDTRFLNFT
jgi:hypothetical protein